MNELYSEWDRCFLYFASIKSRTLMEMRQGILREECVIKTEFLSVM